tara:strand:+ start:1103 stop:1381 length:279 start_codon:yes stop_codon:yes gene_type:complete
MTGVEIVAITSMVFGLFGFLGFLAYLANTNNSKNLKNDYLVIESRCSCVSQEKNVSCEATEVENNSENKDSAKVSRVVRINGIGKQICNKRK